MHVMRHLFGIAVATGLLFLLEAAAGRVAWLAGPVPGPEPVHFSALQMSASACGLAVLLILDCPRRLCGFPADFAIWFGPLFYGVLLYLALRVVQDVRRRTNNRV